MSSDDSAKPRNGVQDARDRANRMSLARLAASAVIVACLILALVGRFDFWVFLVGVVAVRIHGKTAEDAGALLGVLMVHRKLAKDLKPQA